jgi:ribosomal protein L11 methyltransferase
VRWAEIRITAHEESSDAIAQALLDFGCAGAASVAGSPPVHLGWLAVNDDLAPRLDGIRNRLVGLASLGLSAPTEITVRHVEDVRWLDEWRKHHRPTVIGDRILICPSWEAPLAHDHRAVVLLDPGMAFGTGSHPTTRLCLEALDQIVAQGMVVADVGTGSGILAIAAAKLGADRVYASEIDALPRQIAAENIARNGLGDRVTVMTPEQLADLAPMCDLVVCNIIAETIADLTSQLADMLRPVNGILVASGIVEERLHLVTEALERHALAISEIRCDDVWRAVIARPLPT